MQNPTDQDFKVCPYQHDTDLSHGLRRSSRKKSVETHKLEMLMMVDSGRQRIVKQPMKTVDVVVDDGGDEIRVETLTHVFSIKQRAPAGGASFVSEDELNTKILIDNITTRLNEQHLKESTNVLCISVWMPPTLYAQNL
jgi:hypothetical protein